MYSEFVLSADEMKAFLTDRKGAIAGASLPNDTAGKSAIRCRCAERFTPAPGRSRCAVFTTAPSRRPMNRRFFSTGRC
jgi:hypothetical protein